MAPIRKKSAVSGMRRIRPPISSMLRVCVACTTEPAPRNSRHLKIGVVQGVIQPRDESDGGEPGMIRAR